MPTASDLLAFLGVAAAATMAVVGLPPVGLQGPFAFSRGHGSAVRRHRAAFYTMRGGVGAGMAVQPAGNSRRRCRPGEPSSGILTRRWATVAIAWTPRRRRWVVWPSLALTAVLEVRQQVLATLLTGG